MSLTLDCQFQCPNKLQLDGVNIFHILSFPQLLSTFEMHLLWICDLFRVKTFVWKSEHIVTISISNGEQDFLQESQLLNGSPREPVTGRGQTEVLETVVPEKMVTYLAAT